jgi:Na+/serine symporter
MIILEKIGFLVDIFIKYLPVINTFLLFILVKNSNHARKENNTVKVQRARNVEM